MKKFLSIFASFFMLAIFSSCHSIDEFEETPQMVTLKLDCSIGSESTRASGNEMYAKVYNKILSKELVADSYFLMFTNKASGERHILKGNWKTDSVSLKVGSYQVEGVSDASGTGLQQKCSLKFKTEITVTANTTNLVLRGDYSCFLMIFDKKAVEDAYISYATTNTKIDEKHFFELGNFYYAFSTSLYNVEYNTASQYLVVKYKDTIVKINSNKLNTKNGEYYIFDENSSPDDVSALGHQSLSVELPQMNSGKL